MKTVRRPPYPKWNPGYFPCSSLTPPSAFLTPSIGVLRWIRAKEPRLVYLESFEGERDKVNDRENELTQMNKTSGGRRRLRELIERFREPLRLVDLEV